MGYRHAVALAAFAALAAPAARAAAPYEIHVIATMTGISAFLPKQPERGLSHDSSVLVTYDPAGPSWRWLSKIGGAPLN
jgi:hypothetical protein